MDFKSAGEDFHKISSTTLVCPDWEPVAQLYR
jgi:hypothetical protein